MADTAGSAPGGGSTEGVPAAPTGGPASPPRLAPALALYTLGRLGIFVVLVALLWVAGLTGFLGPGARAGAVRAGLLPAAAAAARAGDRGDGRPQRRPPHGQGRPADPAGGHRGRRLRKDPLARSQRARVVRVLQRLDVGAEVGRERPGVLLAGERSLREARGRPVHPLGGDQGVRLAPVGPVARLQPVALAEVRDRALPVPGRPQVLGQLEVRGRLGLLRGRGRERATTSAGSRACGLSGPRRTQSRTASAYVARAWPEASAPA